MSEKLRILEMLKDGIISIEEADRLLRAMDSSKEDSNSVEVIVPKYKTDPKNLVFKIKILSKEGDKVNVNLPLKFAKAALKSGSFKINGVNNDIMNQIDIDQIIQMAEDGQLGELVDITSADGDVVKIVVE
ncbi:MAG TPA: hypothetical protein VJY66_01730 [Acholeplasma sp.]|nr:hypothetical protein [Acholeplasma sp.]